MRSSFSRASLIPPPRNSAPAFLLLLLVTVATMLAAAMALSGVAQAKPTADSANARCEKLAIQTLGPSFDPSNYTFHGGTAGDDVFTGQATEGPEVFCGFGGNDRIQTLDEGDIFLGGAGNDVVVRSFGMFYGQEGNDSVSDTQGSSGTFYGGELGGC